MGGVSLMVKFQSFDNTIEVGRLELLLLCHRQHLCSQTETRSDKREEKHSWREDIGHRARGRMQAEVESKGYMAKSF